MTKSELKEELTKLSVDARRVIEANDGYRTGLLVDMESKSDGSIEVLLDDQLEVELEKVITECEASLDDLKKTVQAHLWANCGLAEMTAAFEEAEKACEYAYSIVINSINCKAYEMHLTLLEKLIKESVEVLLHWEPWIPQSEKTDFQKQLRELKAAKNKLEPRKGEFARALRIAEDAKATEHAGNRVEPPVRVTPVVKIKPTKLPTFSSNKRDFHCWKKDWASLQRQGEPTGSVEVKKIQLLNSVDEKIIKELRLSTHSTANDMFRVLENRYGNKTTIAMEIIEELETIPPVKGNQLRKVIKLIQTMEKALTDLTDLENIGGIKNPLVIKSIECKLPESVKKDWHL
uniref:uncharacterized protein LOC109951383 n=1 Tax=Monopterus albus TaxID=43700 RepID=UPI0009B339C5|nr:uncharacterized protein LOC109951383 [Monopterus albus]